MTDLFRSEWSNNTQVETAWMTAVEESDDDAVEERVALRTVPERSVRARNQAMSRAQAHRLLLALGAAGDRLTQVPIYSDQARTTATSSGSTINCPTAYRRFQASRKVAICNPDGSNVQIRTVSSFTSSAITVTSALTGSYTAGAIVWPLLEADYLLESAANYLTDYYAQVDVVAFERTDADGLPYAPINADATTPSGFTDHGGYPILALPVEWSEGVLVGWERPGQRLTRSRAAVTSLRGTRPRMVVEGLWRFLTRAEAWDMVRFFDSRRGRLMPFWLPLPTGFWSVVSVTTTYIDIEADATLVDVQDYISNVAVVLKNGTVYVRGAAFTSESGNWRCTFDTSIPSISASDILRFVPCPLVRFRSDSMQEEWITDEVMESRLAFIEVVSNAAVETTEEAV